MSCQTACQGNCCTGTDACSYFNGTVCKDGSCASTKACYNASISLVVKSCKGERACDYAERVSSMVNSCNANKSCYYIGNYMFGTATLEVKDSCNGQGACGLVGYDGSIGNITSSCNSKYACSAAGASPPNGTGPIYSKVTSCCNTEYACDYANDLSLPGICFSSSQVRDILAVEFQLSACTLSHVTAIPLSLP